MRRKEPRYRFIDDPIPQARRSADAEFEWKPPRRRFDALSVIALGVIAAFGSVFVYDLVLSGGMSGQLARMLAAADQAQDLLVDGWRAPFRHIEDALAHP